MNTSRIAMAMILGSLTAVAACGSVTPLAVDGGAGQTGHGGSSDAAGQGGSGAGGASGGATGSAGHGGGGGSVTGSAGQGGAGGSDAGVSCTGLAEQQCSATPGCRGGYCPACDGTPTYGGCFLASMPGLFCPAGWITCPCAKLDEEQCLQRPDCRADYCPGCQAKTFVQCARPSDGLPSCPAIKCLLSCAMVTTLVACEARGDCHSVFVDPGTCGCAAPGCCAKFSRCANGDTAMCTGTPACDAATPFCESPYVVAYTATCYEGCVQKKDCAP